MSSKLLLPDFYKVPEKEPDIPLTDRLPQPTGWRILVMPYKGRGKTEGGVFMPEDFVEREAILKRAPAYRPLAYKDKVKFGESEPWCKEGDWVCIGRYAGARFKIDGGEIRIINDDEVIATIQHPDDIYSV